MVKKTFNKRKTSRQTNGDEYETKSPSRRIYVDDYKERRETLKKREARFTMKQDTLVRHFMSVYRIGSANTADLADFMNYMYMIVKYYTPLRVCIIYNHFFNTYIHNRPTSSRISFDDYIGDILHVNKCGTSLEWINIKYNTDLLCDKVSEQDLFYSSDLADSLVPETKRRKIRLFTPHQHYLIVRLINVIFTAVCFDGFFVNLVNQQLVDPRHAAVMASAVVFFCDESLVFNFFDGCSSKRRNLSQNLAQLVRDSKLYDLTWLETPPHNKRNKSLRRQQHPNETLPPSNLEMLAVEYFDPVVEALTEHIQGLGLVLDCEWLDLAQVVATMLFMLVEILNSYMDTPQSDFVDAFTMYVARFVHPSMHSADKSDGNGRFASDKLSVLYFIRAHIGTLKNFGFMWPHRKFDRELGEIVNQALVFLLDVQLRYLCRMIRLVCKEILQVETVMLEHVHYAMFFVMCSNSNSSMTNIEKYFELMKSLVHEQ